MSNNLSIRHLRAFTRVAASGSFTRAADSLHLTQSTLTATIKQLEEQVGLMLLDRTTRRVLLTSEGSRFLPVAERLLSDFDTALSDLQATAEQQQGQLGIAAAPSVLTRLLPAVVNRYHQCYPGIGIRLRDDSAGAIEQRVLENEVDFGLAGNHSSHPDLEYQPLLRDRYGIVSRADHQLASGSEPGWRHLNDQALIYLSADTGIRAQLTAFNRQGVLKLPLDGPLIEVSNPAALAALLEAGMGISVLPALAASVSAFDGLQFTPLQQPVVDRQICVITRKGRSLGPAAETMRQLVRESLAAMKLPRYVGLIGAQP